MEGRKRRGREKRRGQRVEEKTDSKEHLNHSAREFIEEKNLETK